MCKHNACNRFEIMPMPDDKEPVVRIKLVILELGLATNERDCE